MTTHVLPNNTRLVNVNEVRHALQLLTVPGQVVEIRALEASLDQNNRYTRTYGGYFNNPDDLIKAIATIRFAMGIYITLHPCNPDILHRVKNKLVEQKKDFSTPDKYITKYQWLAIDCDPERVSGISSTEEEHLKALAMCCKIREDLRARGWSEPVLADSGNGGHLLYRIDLAIDDKGLMERALKGLAALFDEDGVHVDQTMFNPSRIIKLYGTLACKGDNTAERPHRLSRMLEVPEQMQVVPRELLEAIAVPNEQPKEPATKASSNGHKNRKYTREDFSLDGFIAKHGIRTKSSGPYNGGTRHLLEACAWDPSHTDNSACLYDMPDGLGASCSHNSCQGKHWRDFRLVFEPTAYTAKKQQETTRNNKTEQDNESTKEETALTRLMRIADEAHLICTPSGALYARVPINSHHEIVSIGEKGSGFRRWLVHRFKAEYGFAPNSDAISQTMSGVQADAEFVGEKAEIYTRIAEKDGCVYIDLANDKWQCVEIAPDGWRVITCPPVYFRRPSGMLPLPLPTRGGNLDELKELINAKEDRDYKLITAWLVGTLHPKGPYPILNLNGERGSTKSKGTSILRNIIDPNLAPSRTAPKDDREAAITAQNNMVVALDNLSSMPLWLSDLLCRIATGSGYAARELYTDDGERVFNSRRPIIMNGIEDGIITQGDLLNRTIMVTLTPPDVYRSEEELDDLFREKHPSILGSLLTVASVALRDRKSVILDNPPRMADFAKWIVASESALGWKQGTFIDIYTENQASATSIVMDSSPVAKALVEFMDRIKEKEGKNEWTGLISELHAELTKHDTYKDAKKAPKAPNTLSGHLRRIKSSMLVQGIDIQEGRKTEKGKPITLKRIHPDDTPDDTRYPDDTPRQTDDKNTQYRQFEDPLDSSYNPDNRQIPDDTDDTLPSLTAFYPPFDFEKEEEEESKNGRADRDGKTSSVSSVSSVDDVASIPDDFIYEAEECVQCGCGLARELGSSKVCVRCYPPKGYHTYAHLVDMIYPRKQKVEFSKGGAQ